MCTDNWLHFKGWTKSFTGLEKILTIVEAVLLIAFFLALFYLIDHIIYCNVLHKTLMFGFQTHETPNIFDEGYTPSDEHSSYVINSSNASITCTQSIMKVTKDLEINETNIEDVNGTAADKSSGIFTTGSNDTEHNYVLITEPGIKHTLGTTTESVSDKVLNKNITNDSNEISNAAGEITQATTKTLCTWTSKNKSEKDAQNLEFIDVDKFYRDFVASLVFINDPDKIFRCVLIVVSKNSLIARASCLYRLRGNIITDCHILKLLPESTITYKLYEVTGLWYHPLIWDTGLELYNYAVVKTDNEIDMRTQRFPIVPMNFDIMSIYVGQKVTLLGLIRNISRTQPQNPEKFHGHLIPETNCSEPHPLKLFARTFVDDSNQVLSGYKYYCIAFSDWTPYNLRNFSNVAPAFRGLKFIGFVEHWNKQNPVSFVSLAGMRDWINVV